MRHEAELLDRDFLSTINPFTPAVTAHDKL